MPATGSNPPWLACEDPATVLTARTLEVDAIVQRAWQAHLAGAYPEGLCLVAVGGFGRRELFPCSDVDLWILVEKIPERTSRLSAFLACLWDRQVRLSHAVRSVEEACQWDWQQPEASIALLDHRYLAGDFALYQRFRENWRRRLPGRRSELAQALTRWARTRHARFDGTVYQLEPDVKEAPGGLRDIHLIRWLEALEPDHPLQDGAPPGWQPAWRLLVRIRCLLHWRAGWNDNRLSFEAQEELAEQGCLGLPDAASLMREYYRRAREVHRFALRRLERWEARASSLWRRWKQYRSRVWNAEFSAVGARVWVKAPAQFQRDDQAVLRLFEFVGRHGLPLAGETERRVEDLLPEWSRRIAEHSVWPALAPIVRLPYAARALRAMHETGVLAAVFPEWSELDSLVIRDFHHRYTVDEHTLRALEALEELPRAVDPVRRSLARLWEELDDPSCLRLALLFHDVGKALRSERHAKDSARLAMCALTRIQAPQPLIEGVGRLVELHLGLSEMMATRDPEDPITHRQLVALAGTADALRQLTLLTYADVSAVHPGAMSAWRLQQLWKFYLSGAKELDRELARERIPQLPELPAAVAAFLEGFPARYLRIHSQQDVYADFELGRTAARRGAAVVLRRPSAYYELRLAARDRPHLLASVAGALAAFGMNILRAEGYANSQGMALETFVFEDPQHVLRLNPEETDRLVALLERAAAGTIDVRALLARRAPPARPPRTARVQPSVTFDPDASAQATLIEVVAEDRPGLLYDLARTISATGAHIEVVLIDTRTHRAQDVFYVTRAGHKLDAEGCQSLRAALLSVCGR